MSGRRLLQAGGTVLAAVVVAAYAWQVVPVRWADTPAEARRTLAVDASRMDGRPTLAAGCVEVRADGAVWANLDSVRHRVSMVDAVGDGSVFVFVDGVYVAWSDGPADMVTACAPPRLAADIEAAQP